MLRLIRFSCRSTECILVAGKILGQNEGVPPPFPQSEIYVGVFIIDGAKPELPLL
jgi:hypothetical protein